MDMALGKIEDDNLITIPVKDTTQNAILLGKLEVIIHQVLENMAIIIGIQ